MLDTIDNYATTQSMNSPFKPRFWLLRLKMNADICKRILGEESEDKCIEWLQEGENYYSPWLAFIIPPCHSSGIPTPLCRKRINMIDQTKLEPEDLLASELVPQHLFYTWGRRKKTKTS